MFRGKLGKSSGLDVLGKLHRGGDAGITLEASRVVKRVGESSQASC